MTEVDRRTMNTTRTGIWNGERQATSSVTDFVVSPMILWCASVTYMYGIS